MVQRYLGKLRQHTIATSMLPLQDKRIYPRDAEVVHDP